MMFIPFVGLKMKIKDITEGRNRQVDPLEFAEALIRELGIKGAFNHAYEMVNIGRDPSWLPVLRYLQKAKDSVAKTKRKGMKEGVRWISKGGGVLKKVVVPDSPAERQRKAIAALSKRDKEEKYLTPIPNLDWDKIRRIVDKSGMPLGGEIADIISRKHTTIVRGGKQVAAVKMTVYVYYKLEDFGFDPKEIELRKKYHGDEGVSDAITFYLYRSPKNPNVIKADYAKTDYM